MQFFIKCPEGQKDEWAVIEMQGDLESRIGDMSLGGKFVGDLHYDTAKHTPILIIGHHILHGKIVDCERPLVAIEKKSCPVPHQDQMDVDEDDALRTNTSTEYVVRSIIRKKFIFKTRPKPIIANVPKKL